MFWAFTDVFRCVDRVLFFRSRFFSAAEIFHDHGSRFGVFGARLMAALESLPADVLQRLELRVFGGWRCSALGACHLWRGPFRRGVGVVSCGGFFYSAARAAWFFRYGPIGPGLVVGRVCGNSACVRPAHLFLGTRLEVQRAAFERRRLARSGCSAAAQHLTRGVSVVTLARPHR